MHRIMIALPTTGTVKTPTLCSVFDTVRTLLKAGDDVVLRTVESSTISRSRNYLASCAVHEGASHLLFIDADMTFPASVVQSLLAARRPVVGAIYPKRKIDLARLVELTRGAPDDLPPEAVIAKALDFVVRWPRDISNISFTAEGLASVLGLGMGLTLIETGAFRTMIDNGSAPMTPADALSAQPNWGFFDHVQDPKTGGQLSEDMSFCARWREQCGGEVWALATAKVGHIGDLVHQASVLDHFMSNEELLATRGVPRP